MVLGERLAAVSAHSCPGVNLSRLEGVMVRQEAELRRQLALELAQDGHGLTPQTEAARTTYSSVHTLVSGPLQTFIPRRANPACHLTLWLLKSLCNPPS